MPARRDLGRIFTHKEYRVLVPEGYHNIYDDAITYYIKNHKSFEVEKDITVAKRKSTIIKKAAVQAQLQLSNSLSTTATTRRDHCEEGILRLPQEVIENILLQLPIRDLLSFAQCNHYTRMLCFDNLLWKQICQQEWQDPDYLFVDLSTSTRSELRIWYYSKLGGKDCLNTSQIQSLFQDNLWRVIYIAFNSLNIMPSIVNFSRPMFSRRTTEFLPTTRDIPYRSSRGNFKLKAVNQVGIVEYIVFNNIQPWHKKSYLHISHVPIFCLKDYGLKQTRNARGRHGANFFRHRGYHLKTDENRKIHITYRYFPTIRFRLYMEKEKIFLLCQDIFLKAGQSTDCYTLYEIVRNDTIALDSNQDEIPQEENPMKNQPSTSKPNENSQHLTEIAEAHQNQINHVRDENYMVGNSSTSTLNETSEDKIEIS